MRGSQDGRARPQSPDEAIDDAREELTAFERGVIVHPDAPVPQPRHVEPASAEPDAFSLAIDHLAGTQRDLEAMEQELEALKQEINTLRRRDDTIKFFMTRLDEELRLAARLQQDFLPRQLPQVGRMHFHAMWRPAGYVSGDLYDVMRLDERRVGFFLVDAVGHGMPAALLTMFIKRALICKEIDATGYRLLPPSETMRRLNDALLEQNLSQATFCTALYGVVDTEAMTLTMATGGHPPPLLLRDGKLTETAVEGPLVGIFENEAYGETTLQLQPGDRLLVYSDGIEVAFQSDMDSHTDLWKRELQNLASLPAEGMLIGFSQALDKEVGSLSPKDDLTLLVMEVK